LSPFCDVSSRRIVSAGNNKARVFFDCRQIKPLEIIVLGQTDGMA
jgi:hypothetical protein